MQDVRKESPLTPTDTLTGHQDELPDLARRNFEPAQACLGNCAAFGRAECEAAASTFLKGRPKSPFSYS